MPATSEVFYQYDMFTKEWIDTRTEQQKQYELQQQLPQQLDLFPTYLWLSSWFEEAAKPFVENHAPPCTALMLCPIRSIVVFDQQHRHIHPLLCTPPQLPTPPPVPLLGSGIVDVSKIIPTLAESVVGNNDYFTARLETIRPRIESYIHRRWRGEFDVFELDNLIQAALVYLWQAYRRETQILTTRNDHYWLAIAKRGALYEITHEYRTRFRREGKRGTKRPSKREIVLSAEAVLGQLFPDADIDELDPSLLNGDTVYRSDTPQILAVDRRIDCTFLIQQILSGTSQVDHAMIHSIIAFMREGLTQQEMAKRKNVKVSTIRVTLRRMQQAAGTLQHAKESRKRPGASLDQRIQELRSNGLGGPAIARLIGMHPKFVYRRLEYMRIK